MTLKRKSSSPPSSRPPYRAPRPLGPSAPYRAPRPQYRVPLPLGPPRSASPPPLGRHIGPLGPEIRALGPLSGFRRPPYRAPRLPIGSLGPQTQLLPLTMPESKSRWSLIFNSWGANRTLSKFFFQRPVFRSVFSRCAYLTKFEFFSSFDVENQETLKKKTLKQIEFHEKWLVRG